MVARAALAEHFADHEVAAVARSIRNSPAGKYLSVPQLNKAAKMKLGYTTGLLGPGSKLREPVPEPEPEPEPEPQLEACNPAVAAQRKWSSQHPECPLFALHFPERSGDAEAVPGQCVCQGRCWPSCPNHPVHGHPVQFLKSRMAAYRSHGALHVQSRWRGVISRRHLPSRVWFRQLKGELQTMRVGDVQDEARCAGIDPKLVRAALDDPDAPKAKLVHLILSTIAATIAVHASHGTTNKALEISSARLREQLTGKPLGELRHGDARRAGLSKTTVDKAIADASNDPRDDVIELIIQVRFEPAAGFSFQCNAADISGI